MTPDISSPSGNGSTSRLRDISLIKHVLPIAVAVLIGITAAWYGGNPPEITAAISILTWWVIALGAAAGLFPLVRLSRPALISSTLLLLLVVITVASIIWAADPGRAFVKAAQATSVLGLFSLCLACSRRGSGRGWLAGITAGLTFLVCLGLLGRFLPGIGDDVELTANLSGVAGRLSWPFGYWNALGAAAAMSFVGLLWLAARARRRSLQALAAAFLPALLVAIYLTSSRGAVAALLVGLLVLLGFGPDRRQLAAALLTALATGSVLVGMASQMPELAHAETGATARNQGYLLLALTVVAAMVSAILWIWVAGVLKRTRVWRVPPGAWIAISIGVLVALVIADPVKQVRVFTQTPQLAASGDSLEANTTTAHLLSVGGNGRWQFWSTAFEAFKDEPLHGIGAGGYRDFYAEHRETPMIARHAHSLPLQILGELGLLGALIALLFLLTILSTAWQRWREERLDRATPQRALDSAASERSWTVIPPLLGIASAGLLSMSIDWTAEFPAIAAPVLIALACLAGPATMRAPEEIGDEGSPAVDHEKQPDGTGSPSGLTASLVAALAILLAGGSIWIAAISFGVATNLNASRSAVSAGDLDRAAQEAKDAIDLLPKAAEPRVQLALVEELQGDYRSALASVNDAIERGPRTSSSHLLRARILLRLQRDRQAKTAYERARELDPLGAIFDD